MYIHGFHNNWIFGVVMGHLLDAIEKYVVATEYLIFKSEKKLKVFNEKLTKF